MLVCCGIQDGVDLTCIHPSLDIYLFVRKLVFNKIHRIINDFQIDKLLNRYLWWKKFLKLSIDYFRKINHKPTIPSGKYLMTSDTDILRCLPTLC